MNASTVQLVRGTWAQVLPHADAACRRFYTHLFTADPALRPLFKGDLDAQATQFMKMIDIAVGLLNQPDVLLPELQRLGRRHLQYGVQSDHYDTVGAALLHTLEEELGAEFTHEARVAWAEVYRAMSTVMRG